MYLGEVIELEVIELGRWAVWAQKNEVVRMGLMFQRGPFAVELKYSLAPR